MLDNLLSIDQGHEMVDIVALSKYLEITLKLEPNSIRLVLGRWHIFQNWLYSTHAQLVKQTVSDFLYYRKHTYINPRSHAVGCRNNTLNSYIFAFRMIKSYAESNNLSWANAFDELVSYEKEDAEIDPLSQDEINRLLAIDIVYGVFRGKDPSSYLNLLYRTMSLVLIFSGCRYENCQRLLVKDVSIEKQILRFRDLKNHMKYLDAWVPSVVIDAIKPFLEGKKPDNLVFVSFARLIEQEFNSPVAPSTFGFELRKRANAAKITKRVHPHIFRHCFGTRLLENGVNIENVAKMLGHRDIQSTYRYYDHVCAQFLKMEKLKDPMVMKYTTDEEIYQSVKSRLLDLQLAPKVFLYVIGRLSKEFL